MGFNSMCRTCRSTHGLMNIFDMENDVLVVMLQKLASIFIEEDDLLPKQICYSCANSLKMAFEFIVQCQKTEEILRTRLDKGMFDEETPHKVPDDWVGVPLKIKPVEQINLQSELDLKSIIFKEDYLEEIELIERGICGGIHKKIIDDEGIEFDENDIIEVDEEFLDETTDMTLVNCINEYSEEVIFQDTMIDLKPAIVKQVAKKRYKRAPKVKSKKPRPIKEKKTYICSICSATFIEFTEYKAHRQTHLPYVCACKLCGRQFAKTSGLQTHMGAHNGTKVACHICGAQCSNRGNLLRHIRSTHDNIRPYPCEVCGMRFARKSAMRIHAEAHTEERNHTCDMCEKKFKTSIGLYSHKRIHLPHSSHTKSQQKYKYSKFKICICEVCGKRSNSTAAHINHKQIHSAVKKFKCELCPKGFHFKLGLDTHMLKHTGEKPHACDICGKKFRQSVHLKKHKLAMHDPTGRAHKCQYCGKGFIDTVTLQGHERIHTGERPFACNFCQLGFIDRSALCKHRKKFHNQSVDSLNAGRENAVKTVVLDENNTITIHESAIGNLSVDQGHESAIGNLSVDQGHESAIGNLSVEQRHIFDDPDIIVDIWDETIKS